MDSVTASLSLSYQQKKQAAHEAQEETIFCTNSVWKQKSKNDLGSVMELQDDILTNTVQKSMPIVFLSTML